MPRKRKTPNDRGEYQCSKCNQWKPPSEFNKNKQQTSGLSHACRDCLLDMTRGYNLEKKYGISVDTYNQMLYEQKSRCDCCGVELIDKGSYNTRPCIDHNHKTGEVRSLLCPKCNLAIGNLNDDSSYALMAYKYLEKHSC